MPPGKSKDANAARRCGKAWKKKPGISPAAHNGKTESGYTPAKAAARAAKRSVSV
jgi:hypothetical protein